MPPYIKKDSTYTVQEDFYQIGSEIIGNCCFQLDNKLLKLKYDLENRKFKNADEIMAFLVDCDNDSDVIIID